MMTTQAFSPEFLRLFANTKTAMKKASTVTNSDERGGKALFQSFGTGKQSYANYYEEGGLGQAEYLTEGSDPTAQEPRPGNQKAVRWDRYATAIAFTEDHKALLPEYVKKYPAMLVQATRDTEETLRQIFYGFCIEGATTPAQNGRVVVDTLAVDGKKYFHSAHDFLGVSGITNSNLSAVARTWSSAAIESMRAQAAGWRGSNTFERNMPILRFIVGKGLAAFAHVILKTDRDPNNGNNAYNVARYLNNGSPVQDTSVWNGMGDDDFMAEFALKESEGELGWVHVHPDNDQYKLRAYSSNSGRRETLDREIRTGFTGCCPYKFLTSRAPVT